MIEFRLLPVFYSGLKHINNPTCNGKEYRLLPHLYSCGRVLYLIIILYEIGKGTDLIVVFNR